MLGWLHGYVMVVDRWHGKVEHIGGLNVSHLFEHGDKLGEVVKAGKSCFGAIARAFGVEFVKILFVDFLN